MVERTPPQTCSVSAQTGFVWRAGRALFSVGRVAPVVYTYRSCETGLFANSYLVEGTEGIVAIDAPLLLSDCRAYRARLEASHKPLLGVLLTHPHTDHYNTVGELLAGWRAPVIAHRDVNREIRAKQVPEPAGRQPLSAGEWPGSGTLPNQVMADEESVELGQLLFTAWDFGPCESASETVWLLGDGDTAFIGDLAFNGTHANLAEGRTDAWLRAIDRAEDALAGVRTLYVGHGPPATTAVLAEQRRYLLMARETIGHAAEGRARLTEDEAQRVAGLMGRYLPGAPLSRLVAAGASAVAAELAQESALA
jgi:glyoxylase-like metal-dependent hydrolase (beta-lactamase superfamily II)